MTDPHQIARSLSEAQREALLLAEIKPPHSIMPTYHSVQMSMGRCDHDEREALQKLGLVTLPICSGGRYGGGIYHGEIHPLGLAVRAIIEAEEHSNGK